ncbi:MAG: class I SAM-dependent methyltransferase [Lentisphaerae bacterium]|nr:class I SAM-dependent methyltransferase [Lentisphaerota bacterium]
MTNTCSIAFKDIDKIIKNNSVNLTRTLDLGCGFWRSTSYLQKFNPGQIFGSDIDEKSVDYCRKNNKDCTFFLNTPDSLQYEYNPFSAIFSILMLFHLETADEVKKEMKKCFFSLANKGHLIIITRTKELYTANYTSSRGVKAPINSGDRATMYLSDINLVVEDTYWSEQQLIDIATEVGFESYTLEYPLAEKFDETILPPFLILTLLKR